MFFWDEIQFILYGIIRLLMRVVGKLKIEKFTKKHAAAKGPLNAWLKEAERAAWSGPHDIKQRFAHASFLADNLVIFNIGGNKFRLEVTAQYKAGVLIVRDINTHAEYDKKNKKR